ncbi:hypothetical protein HPB50_026222 [Hyalomma asiaticum]|uniref:Uncharacterized protein n=1 Tax=Hyalomma asiaticum TaxID=266040 RepID=A0ACB7S6M4_HYAAI|nr:hypothetical protein HPB50_026222 [Hyalomma asiaticum]
MAPAKLGPPGGPQKLTHDTPDTMKVIENFPYSVAISDSDNDTVFECVAANRTAIDRDAQTATFVWLFQGNENHPKQNIPFYVKTGDEPGTLLFTVEGGDTLYGSRDELTEEEIDSMKDDMRVEINAQSPWLPRFRRMPSGEEIAETYHRVKEALRDAYETLRDTLYGSRDELTEEEIDSMKDDMRVEINAQSPWLPRFRRMPSGEEIAETYHRVKEALRDAYETLRRRVGAMFH